MKKLTKQQKWFLFFDSWLLVLLGKGFIDTFILNRYSEWWFAFALFIVIAFNIVEFPRE